MGTKPCPKKLFFSTRFSCEYFAAEDFVPIFMGKNLVVWEMFFWVMVSTNLYNMFFYAGEIQNSNYRRLEMATTYFFLTSG